MVELLKGEYNRRAEFSPLLWSKGMKLQLKEVYTRLKVVSRRKAGSSEIDVDDIFKSSGEDKGQLVLAEGSPGIGKTTFCLKLAHDWANGAITRNFPTFKLVFLLKCRDMKGGILKDIDLVEDIFEQLLPEDLKEKIKKSLVNFLEDLNNQKQILIILDGLDELPDKSEDRVNKVLSRKKVSFCYVLATTRQEKGIYTREQFKFDICLAIEGFSEKNSIEYIRKHFRSIGTEHSYKGERLIEEIARNSLLRDLQSNPLNLLLLCVVYEDYEGILPPSITELYRIIVRCLLERYCAREELKAFKKGDDLEKQFEIPILALGELAWKCLLNDRLSFYEDELEELERSNENIVARRLGLVYKEESLKRLKPRHEYSFLHKTFQEYLAASYIAHKLRGGEFQMLEKMLSPDIATSKFRKVFVFLCGILREEATILFELIGNMLQKQWDWLKCHWIFFVDSWKETGNAERMAKTLCSFLPFPRSLYVWNVDQCHALCVVVKEFSEFPQEMTFAEVHISPLFFYSEYGSPFLYAFEDLRTLREKLTFALFANVGEGVSKLPDFGLSSVRLRICGSLGSSSLQEVENLLLHKCLSSLSITVCGDVQESLVEALSRGLAGESAVKFLDLCLNGNFSFRGAYLLQQGILRNRSLTNIKISLNGEPPENWQAVAKNLFAQFAEKAIVSEIYPNTFSKVKDSHVTHLNRFLSKTDLKQQTVTLNVWGELSGDGCKAVGEVLLHTPLTCLTLNIHGQLTDEMLRYIARCVEEREKLLQININAWVEMTEKENKLIKELGLDKNPLFSLNVRATRAPLKESSDSKVVSSDEPQSLIALFEKATKGPSKFTEDTSQKSLTIKINDDKSNERGHGLGEGLARNSSLESLTIKINKYNNVNWKWEYGVGEVLAGNTSLKSLTLEIDDYGDNNDEWGRGLGGGLARNTSLKSLTLKIGSYCDRSKEWGRDLAKGLARNTSLETLTIKIMKAFHMSSEWENGLCEGLAGNTSLKSLTFEIDCYYNRDAKWGRVLGEGLATNSSLESLTIKINDDKTSERGDRLREWSAGNTSLKSLTIKIINACAISSEWGSEWEHGLCEGLAGNTSLKSLTLEIDCYYEGRSDTEGGSGLGEGLARNTSLESLTIKIIMGLSMSSELDYGLCVGLARNTSLKSLTLEIDCYYFGDTKWGRGLGEGLARNTSLESLTIKIIKFFRMSSELDHGLCVGLARNTSLKSLTLEVDCYYEEHCDPEGGRVLGEGLARNTSLESLTIKIIKFFRMSSELDQGLFVGLARNTSLKSLTLEIDCYCNGHRAPKWGRGLGEGLARNTSLESLTLAINNGNDTSDQWGHVLCESLPENNSLNSLTLAINNFSDISDEWGVGLAEGLARSTCLKSITLTMNNYFYMSSAWVLGLFEGSAKNTSLKSMTLSINNYGVMKGERRHDIIEGLARNASLTSITLAINNYADMTGEWGHCLFESLARNTSLNSLTLTANNYSDMSEEWGCALREDLRKSSSLTERNLIVDICGKC